MIRRVFLLTTLAATLAGAAILPYEESVDAKAAVQQALSAAKAGLNAEPVKKGIPAAVVLSPDARVLYATRAGELADARRMSESGIHDFFKGVVAEIRAARARLPSG